MVDILTLYTDMIMRYWWALLIGGGAVLVYYLFIFNNKGKPALKAINRGEVERKNFIRRMGFNKSKFKLLLQDGTPRLWISHFQASEFKTKDKDTPQKVFELIAQKPTFILGIRLPFMSRPEPYIFNADNIILDTARPTELNLRLGITLWEKLGVFYDNTLTETAIETFTRQFNAQTDYENISAEFYAAAQEESVINHDRAHMTLSDHLTLEQINAKKRTAELGG